MKNNEDKKRANFDTTYCTNETCMNKCWRYINNWEFDQNENYWLMEYCEEGDLDTYIKNKELEYVIYWE